MTLTATITPSPNATDGKDTATHKMPCNERLARAGVNGHVELWAWGAWTQTGHHNWMLDGDYPHWFVPLKAT